MELQKEAKEKAEALKVKYTSLAKDLGVMTSRYPYNDE